MAIPTFSQGGKGWNILKSIEVITVLIDYLFETLKKTVSESIEIPIYCIAILGLIGSFKKSFFDKYEVNVHSQIIRGTIEL